jgi:hypothetical protein
MAGLGVSGIGHLGYVTVQLTVQFLCLVIQMIIFLVLISGRALFSKGELFIV